MHCTRFPAPAPFPRASIGIDLSIPRGGLCRLSARCKEIVMWIAGSNTKQKRGERWGGRVREAGKHQRFRGKSIFTPSHTALPQLPDLPYPPHPIPPYPPRTLPSLETVLNHLYPQTCRMRTYCPPPLFTDHPLWGVQVKGCI